MQQGQDFNYNPFEMRTAAVIFIFFLFPISIPVFGQADSLLATIKQVPARYLHQVEEKVTRYANRISSKTEKTLTKLARWEAKIKGLLEKASPETAQRLFGNSQLTFSVALEKYKEGKLVLDGYRARYDEYRDKLTTSLKYLDDQKEKLDSKVLKPLVKVKEKVNELEEDVKNTEAMQQFIKERRKQLLNEAVKYLGKSKYLAKIDKEAYYYIETLRNYKEIFSDKTKAEEVARKILDRIPAFKEFTQKNSMLAQLFGSSNMGSGAVPNLAGLQTRASVNSLIQERLAMGGPNARELFSQHLQQAQMEMSSLKDRVLKAGGSSGDAEIPSFKPNTQRSKTFWQRLEYSGNFQFGKNNSLMPATADIALSVGYKLNDRSLIGIGASYKMGFGSIQRLSISHQGLGLRSFIDWRLKKQFFITGGFEMNYNAQFRNMAQLRNYQDWQQAGLVGITKKLNIKTKLFKATSVQLLYDMLHQQHVPVSQPVLFRVGYSFK